MNIVTLATGLPKRITTKKENGRITGICKDTIEEKIVDLLPLVGLKEELLQKFPDEISGGQKQRVGIIRAIAHDPKIVLMDEPFSALDSETRDKLQILVKDIHEKLKTTFVMVTHSQQEAEVLSTHILHL